MKHPYDTLAPEYADLLPRLKMEVKVAAAALKVAHRLLLDADKYQEVERVTNVPALWLMATNEREGGGRLDRYLGNGQVLTRRTTIVPAGRGPFPGPKGFVNGAIDALTLDQVTGIQSWTGPLMCYHWEAWNGWGPRDNHKVRTSYLWGGSNLQQPGKYIADHVWSNTVMDQQLGTVVIARAILQLAPELSVPGWDLDADAPTNDPAPPAPSGLEHVRWLQHALNLLGQSPAISEDNNYGRETYAAVRAFQHLHRLAVDGIAGPVTLRALEDELSRRKLAS